MESTSCHSTDILNEEKSQELMKLLVKDDLETFKQFTLDTKFKELSYTFPEEDSQDRKSCCKNSNKNIFEEIKDPVNYTQLLHMCVFCKSFNIISYLIEECKVNVYEIAVDGSNILHTVAKVHAWTELYNGKLELVNEAKQSEFEDFLFNILEQQKEKDNLSNSLLTLCYMENNLGLRPLEYTMRNSAYKLVTKMLNINKYIKTNEVNMLVATEMSYDLAEYDIFNGSRKTKNPLLIMCFLSSFAVQSYKEAALLEHPLIKKWMDHVFAQVRCLVLMRLVAFLLLTLMLTPLNIFRSDSNIALLLDSYEMEKGFYVYVKHIQNISSMSPPGAKVLFNSTIVNGVDMCAYSEIRAFVYDPKGYGSGDIKQVLGGHHIKRMHINQFFESNLICVLVIFTIQVLLIIFHKLVGYLTKRVNKWVPQNTQFYIIATFFDSAFLISTISLGGYLLCKLVEVYAISCHDQIIKKIPFNVSVDVLPLCMETFLIIYIFTTFAAAMEIAEIFYPRVAFLFICFRKMIQSFTRALPLLIIWMYAVFGVLFYCMDYEAKEFVGIDTIAYGPLRLLLNMASWGNTPRASVVILHTMYVLVVTINVQNFLIAFISNEFNQTSETFDIYFMLGKLNYTFETVRLYGFIRYIVCKVYSKVSKNQKTKLLKATYTNLQ